MLKESTAENPPAEIDDGETFAWSTIETLATEVWKGDPVYKPYYHPTGFIYTAVGDDAYAKVQESVQSHPENWQPACSRATFQVGKAILGNEMLAGWQRERLCRISIASAAR